MEQILHLFITNKCRHDCEFCCNKLYDIEKIPVVTVELLKSVQTVCLTGGEPFCITSELLKPFIMNLRNQYHNIKNLYIYTSGKEFGKFGHGYKDLIELSYIDGINIAPKDWEDWKWFGELLNLHELYFPEGNSSHLYVFKEQKPIFEAMCLELEGVNIKVIDRVWDNRFNTPSNEYFARLPILF